MHEWQCVRPSTNFVTHGEAEPSWSVQASIQSTHLLKEAVVVFEDGLRTAHHIHELHGSWGSDESRVVERALHDEALLPVIICEPVAQQILVSTKGFLITISGLGAGLQSLVRDDDPLGILLPFFRDPEESRSLGSEAPFVKIALKN